MVKTVTIDYNGETIILFDGTVTNKCLIYENPDWKIKITLRDAISFQINITHSDASSPEGNFDYQCRCMIEKNRF